MKRLGIVLLAIGACARSAPSPPPPAPAPGPAPAAEASATDDAGAPAPACVALPPRPTATTPPDAGTWPPVFRKPSPVIARLANDACYGTCPVYVVTVHADGFLEFDGEAWVQAIGHREKDLPRERVKELERAFERAGFFALRDKYTHQVVTDHATTTLTFVRGKATKKVEHYHGDPAAPKALRTLEEDVDRIVAVDDWIGPPEKRQRAARSPAMEDEDRCNDCVRANCGGRRAHCIASGKEADCETNWAVLEGCLRAGRGKNGDACTPRSDLSEPVGTYVACLLQCCRATCESPL